MLCAGSQGSQAAELPAVLVINTVEVATAAQPVDQPHQRTDVDADGSSRAFMAEQLPLASSESRYSLLCICIVGPLRAAGHGTTVVDCPTADAHAAAFQLSI